MENELKTRAVRLSPQEQYEIRKHIIRMAEQGKSNAEIAQMQDVSERLVRAVKKAYREKGIDGIKVKRRGRKTGEKRRLSPEQEKEIRQAITDKTPDQLKFKECMWRRKNIQELTRRKCGIKLPVSTLGYYLQRWGFSVQRPVRRAYKQDESKVTEWVEKTFPGITNRAKKEDADIFFGDETGIQNTSNYARGYAPVGHAPVAKTEAKHIKINMLSAVSCRGMAGKSSCSACLHTRRNTTPTSI